MDMRQVATLYRPQFESGSALQTLGSVTGMNLIGFMFVTLLGE